MSKTSVHFRTATKMPRSANVMEISIESFARDLRYFQPIKKKHHFEPGAKHLASRQQQRNDNVLEPDTTLDMVDRSMDIQQILYELAMHVNTYFRFQALILMMTAFMLIVFDCYYLIEEFTSTTSCS